MDNGASNEGLYINIFYRPLGLCMTMKASIHDFEGLYITMASAQTMMQASACLVQLFGLSP